MIAITKHGPEDEGPALGQVDAGHVLDPDVEDGGHQRPEEHGGASEDDQQEGDVAVRHGDVVGHQRGPEVREQPAGHAAEHRGHDPGRVLVEPGVVPQGLHALLVVVDAAECVAVVRVHQPVHQEQADDADREDQVVERPRAHLGPEPDVGLRDARYSRAAAGERPAGRWPCGRAVLRTRWWPEGSRWGSRRRPPHRTPGTRERPGWPPRPPSRGWPGAC